MDLPNNESPDRTGEQKLYPIRRILAQVLATTVKNFLLFDMGLCTAFPTIVIPALTGIHNKHNGNEFLSITPTEASWMGSIVYLSTPIGCLISSIVTDPLGRKHSMFLVNIPYAIGWIMLCRATEVWEVFFGLLMQGLAVGLLEAAAATYLGESCEPSTRGVMLSYSLITFTLGIFTCLFMNTLMAWRSVALVCLMVPVISAVSICFIPETPHWHLSKNHVKKAEQSLRWLRGWVPREAIAHEFNELKRHSERSKSCNHCTKLNQHCSHPLPTFKEKLIEFKRESTLKPFFIITMVAFLGYFTGESAMRPFIVQIFKAYESPIPPDQSAAVMSVIIILANIVFMCLVRFTGKRKLYLTMAFGVFLSSFVIALYGFSFLPSGYISFGQQIQSTHLVNSNLTYIPMVCLLLWSFFTFCGLQTMPWMLISETRGIATGTAGAITNLMGFVSKKTYYSLETTLSLPGISLLHCMICGSGLILMYLILPETENQTLEDIERHFSDNSKKITDRKIAKSQNSQNYIELNVVKIDEKREQEKKIEEAKSLIAYQNKELQIK